MVDPHRVLPGSAEEQELKALLREHVAETGSARGAHVLAQWDEALPHFWHVTPNTKPLKERSQALVHVPLWSVRTPAGTEAPSTPFIPLTPAQRQRVVGGKRIAADTE
jgi:hypothetical protein